MTKSEFDKLFVAGKCYVIAETGKQWIAINRYAEREFGCGRNANYHNHDCSMFPLVFCDVENGGIINAVPDLLADAFAVTLSFDKFVAVTQGTGENAKENAGVSKLYLIESGFDYPSAKRDDFFRRNPKFTFEIRNGCAVFRGEKGCCGCPREEWVCAHPIVAMKCTENLSYIRITNEDGETFHITWAS